MLNCGLRQHSFQSLPWVARTGAEHTRHGRSRVWHQSSAAALQGHGTDTGMNMGPQKAGKSCWKRERGKNGEGNGNERLWTKLALPSPRLMPAGKSLPLLWGMGTLTPLGPLPALFFSVFLWEPFTSSRREVCVYFSSLPFDSNSPLFFCQRVRNKFRFKRQPEMCMQAKNSFIFIML